jgi:hypothetical protein
VIRKIQFSSWLVIIFISLFLKTVSDFGVLFWTIIIDRAKTDRESLSTNESWYCVHCYLLLLQCEMAKQDIYFPQL